MLKDSLSNVIKKAYIKILGEKRWAVRRYKKTQGKMPDLDNPKTLNEKMVWLKLHYFKDFHVRACDKYLVHDYLKEKIGFDYTPELLYVTQNPKALTVENIRTFPCIIKVSNGSGSNLIVRDKNQFTNDYLTNYFTNEIINSNMHVLTSLEHQYLTHDPYIVVEKLLIDEKGGIPNDYKFLYINGELQFIYCSIDRLGIDVRHVYNPDWKRLHFIWVAEADKELFEKYDNTPNIERPVNFEKMVELSHKIAEDFPLVRVDFYEIGRELYIGEITLHHGSGGDVFYPEKYDSIYGGKLILPKANR